MYALRVPASPFCHLTTAVQEVGLLVVFLPSDKFVSLLCMEYVATHARVSSSERCCFVCLLPGFHYLCLTSVAMTRCITICIRDVNLIRSTKTFSFCVWFVWLTCSMLIRIYCSFYFLFLVFGKGSFAAKYQLAYCLGLYFAVCFFFILIICPLSFSNSCVPLI